MADKTVYVQDPTSVDRQAPIPVRMADMGDGTWADVKVGKDGGPAWTSSRQTTISADLTGAGDLTAAPTSTQKIVVDDIIISAAAAMYLSLLEETSGTELMRIYLPANGTVQITPRGKFKLPVADKKLRGDASAAGGVSIVVFYHSEA